MHSKSVYVRVTFADYQDMIYELTSDMNFDSVIERHGPIISLLIICSEDTILWLDSHADLYPDFAFYAEKHFRPGPGTMKEVPDEIPADDPDAPGARTVYSIGALDFDAETGDFL